MTLGERIRTYRQMQGLSQDELAEKLNVSRQAVSRWENGSSDPSTSNLIALAKIYNTTVEEILNSISK